MLVLLGARSPHQRLNDMNKRAKRIRIDHFYVSINGTFKLMKEIREGKIYFYVMSKGKTGRYVLLTFKLDIMASECNARLYGETVEQDSAQILLKN